MPHGPRTPQRSTLRILTKGNIPDPGARGKRFFPEPQAPGTVTGQAYNGGLSSAVTPGVTKT